MRNEKRIEFDPFCLDLSNQCLWRGAQAIKLRPKAFAVLEYLLGHPGQLATKEELLNAVWPGTFVGEAVLKVAIREIREAVGDDPNSPRFIETAHRRGYRFIGQIAETRKREAADSGSQRAAESAPGFVGREEALSRMQGWLERMLGGERQIAFVTGEAGIGKTSLVDTFARTVATNGDIRIGRGQCLEQYGTSEAYLPVLEAIGRLCREHREIVDVLRAHAPMWLLQLPSVLDVSDRELLSREVAGATRERMLREMADALEVITVDVPLVLILEDLHWSDYSTLDLISYLATQRQPAHLMVIGTYRMVELIVSGHPLKAVKRELLAKQQCDELPLKYLSEAAIGEYLSVRFPHNRFPAELVTLIGERTEGNPLFMVNVIDYLVAEQLIVKYEERWELAVGIDKVKLGVPESIKQMIEKQFDRIDATGRRILEAASVAGTEFSTLAVAAALGEEQAAIDTQCEELARQRQFIQDSGVQILPNAETVNRYRFIHALYENVLYDRLSRSRRVQLHQRIGARDENLYGDRAGEIAAELAMHFERGRDYERAAKYLRKAAENASRRFAYQDAVRLSRRGLELLETLPDSAERVQEELHLQLTLGVPLIATEGYAAPDVRNTYRKARELLHQAGESPDVSEVLWGLWASHTVRAELTASREIAEEFLRLAERLPYPGLAMRGHLMMGVTFAHMGEIALSMEHSEKALALYDPERHLDDVFSYSQNPGVAMQCHAAWALWLLGQPDQALLRMDKALTLARELSEPHGLAHAHFFASVLHQLRREPALAQERAEVGIAVSREHGLMMYQAHGMVALGWALSKQGRQEEAIEHMRKGIAAHKATGAEVMRPHFLAVLAEALGTSGRHAEAGRVLEEAFSLMHHNGERYYEAELYRLKGELLLQQTLGRAVSQSASGGKKLVEVAPPSVMNAERCFDQSIKIARQQNAKSFELRAVTSIARLYRSQGRQRKGRDLLAEIYDRFTEGFDTMDLREAKALLDEGN